MMINKFKNNSTFGFTMIELLVVISIIGILASLAFVSFSASQKQANDTARKSDLKQYATALENFANANSGLYPARGVSAGVSASSVLCGDINLSDCPEDSKNDNDSSWVYKYQSEGAVSDGTATTTKYVLWSKLENSDNYWVVCSTGKSGTAATSGFSVSDGDCPI